MSDCEPSSIRTTCLGRRPLTPRVAEALGSSAVIPLAHGIAWLFAAVVDGMVGPYCSRGINAWGRDRAAACFCVAFAATCKGGPC